LTLKGQCHQKWYTPHRSDSSKSKVDDILTNIIFPGPPGREEMLGNWFAHRNKSIAPPKPKKITQTPHRNNFKNHTAGREEEEQNNVKSFAVL
jgi:hypothetical protein